MLIDKNKVILLKVELIANYDEGWNCDSDQLEDNVFMGFEINLIPESKDEKEFIASESFHLEPFYSEKGFTILYSEDDFSKPDIDTNIEKVKR